MHVRLIRMLPSTILLYLALVDLSQVHAQEGKGITPGDYVTKTGSKDGGTALVQRPRSPRRPEPADYDFERRTTDVDRSLYLHPTNPIWVDDHLKSFRETGLEKAGLFGEHLFADSAGGDSRFRPGHPAMALGIESLDVSNMGRLEKRSLPTSDGSRFVPKAAYPQFSWDTIPMYFMFGDTQRVLHPKEVEFIAERTDFLCIEKSHGFKPLGAAELGAKHEAAAFKQIKPDMKVLFYFNAAYAYPFTSYSHAFTSDRIDQHPELRQFLLVDPETGELARRGSVFFFDVLNREFREWWVTTVARGVTDTGCDGAFIDQMHGFRWLREDKSEDVEKAMGDMMVSLKKKLGPDTILLANNANQAIARHVFPAIDATMFEHYSETLLSKERLLQDWADMLRLAKVGKMSIFRIGVESDRGSSQLQSRRGSSRDRSARMAALARDRLEYYLACYLIGAQPWSYFQYGWGWTLSSGSLQDYPALHRPLGAPNGAYRRTTPDGWEFTRDFEHAHVWVDTDKGQARITWR